MYPPGQFAPWNSPALRTAQAAGRPAPGSLTETPAPDYSLLAVSDPAADATATQTWAVLNRGQLDDDWADPGGRVVPPGSPWTAGTAQAPAEDSAAGRVRPWPGAGDEPAGSPQRHHAAATQDRPGTTQDGPRTAQGRPGTTPDRPGAESPESGPRGPRPAARGRPPGQDRKPAGQKSRKRMWLMPLAMAVVVAVLVAVAYLQFVRGRNSAAGVPAPRRPATASSSPSPTLGPWKHITTRAEDPLPLALSELFPARLRSSGVTAVRAIQRAGKNCPRMVLGAKLQAALRQADCTQVMRASYLAARQKIMVTIGVLNLADVTGAERAGKATGATAFIRQLPGPRGPTRNLAQGTGLEEAQFKGHYLILTWAEFTNLKAPANARQRRKLDAFSRTLVAATANISLTSRELFGKPQTP